MFTVIMVLLISSFGLGQSMSTMGDGEKVRSPIILGLRLPQQPERVKDCSS